MTVSIKKSFRDFDWLVVLLTVSIAGFGVWQIYNAQPAENFWEKQLLGLIIGLIVLLALAFTDYHQWIQAAPFLYVGGLGLLILVIIPGVGMRINGHQSWIRLPLIGQFQPSEFVKIPTLLMLAKYFGQHAAGQTLKFKEFVTGTAILLLPLALIMLEPDAGTSVTYFPLLATTLFLSAIKVRWVLLSILAALVLMPAAYWASVKTGKIKTYQQERINNLLDPEKADPKGNGYQTLESMITVGKGRLTGAGNSTDSQSALKFLPEPQSDFIFAVTAEHTGFLGCISLLFVYAMLLSRLIEGARQAFDRTEMLIIMAIAGELAFQIFINIGMALGIMPVIGVPLPLMSAGISSVLATFVAIGFFLSIRMRRFVN